MDSECLSDDEKKRIDEWKLNAYVNLYSFLANIKITKEKYREKNLSDEILNKSVSSWNQFFSSSESSTIIKFRELLISFLDSNDEGRFEVLLEINELMKYKETLSAITDKGNLTLFLNEMLPLVLREKMEYGLAKSGISISYGFPDWGVSPSMILYINYNSLGFSYDYEEICDYIILKTMIDIEKTCSLRNAEKEYREEKRRRYRELIAN
jgi:hypothetical protein